MCGITIHSLLWLQDLAGLRMNMLNQNTIKVFKSISGIYQDHYPVSAIIPASPAGLLPAASDKHLVWTHSQHLCSQCAALSPVYEQVANMQLCAASAKYTALPFQVSAVKHHSLISPVRYMSC